MKFSVQCAEFILGLHNEIRTVFEDINEHFKLIMNECYDSSDQFSSLKCG